MRANLLRNGRGAQRRSFVPTLAFVCLSIFFVECAPWAAEPSVPTQSDETVAVSNAGSTLTHALKLSITHAPSVQHTGGYFGKELYSRTLRVSPIQHADLDDTALGKAKQLAVSTSPPAAFLKPLSPAFHRLPSNRPPYEGRCDNIKARSFWRESRNTVIDKEQALPGRPEPMQISDKHYVFGTPMKGPWPEKFQMFVFANGCFWGSEKGVWRLPGGGIHSTAVGYAGGFTPNPSYEEACSEQTGHTEAVQVVFDPSKISMVDILRWFWESHDPTSGMGQGNDRGTQYRSGLYYFDDEQRQIFEASKAAYEKTLEANGKGMGPKITTEIRSAADFPDSKVFYYAEDYHQQYLAKPGSRPYCSAQPQVVSLPPFEDWAPPGLQEKYAPKLGEDFWRQHGPTGAGCVIRAPTAPIEWP